MNKDLEYPIKGYRLKQNTIDNLAKIKNEEGLSYNMLFVKFIKNNKIKK